MSSSNILAFGRRVQRVQNTRHLIISKLYTTGKDLQIAIPLRIHREPTDILKVLAGTVQRDPTAAHYKFHDDPYLIPSANIAKRNFALSQESGRKAAHWIRQQHSDLFQHKVADPPIQAFMPPVSYDDDSDVSEEILKKVITDMNLSNAVTVYQLMVKKKIDVSRKTKQSLLELVCYHSEADPLAEDWIEERWYRMVNRGREKQRKTWKDNGLAESLFSSLAPQDSLAYSALIQGMARHCQMEHAWKLYQDAIALDLQLDIGVYNALISRVNFLRSGAEHIWSLVEDIMNGIKAQGLRPNAETLNAVLESISCMGTNPLARVNALRTFAEFKLLNITPNLTSYYYLLIIFCKERGPSCTILVDVLKQLEGQELLLSDPRDTFFFVTAMDICRHHLYDKHVAYRIHAMLNNDNNYNFIGDSYKESIYYRHYFVLLCETEPLDKFMAETYDKLVPHIYIPEPGVMEVLLKVIDTNRAVQYVPKIWEDMVTFEHTDRDHLMAGILRVMMNNEDANYTDKLAVIAWQVWLKIENQRPDRFQRATWSGAMLGDVLVLSLRGDQWRQAVQVMAKILKEQHKILGEPTIESLTFFIDHAIKNGDAAAAIGCIKYCCNLGFPEATEIAQRVKRSLKLSSKQTNILVDLVGRDVLDEEQSTEAIS